MNYKDTFLKIAVGKYNVNVKFDKKRYFDAEVRRDIMLNHHFFETIHLKDIKNTKHLAIAFHELGHTIQEDYNYLITRYFKVKFRFKDIVTYHIIKEEFNAWKRAKEVSPIWNNTMNNMFIVSMNSYIKNWQTDWKTKINRKRHQRLLNLDNPYFNV